MPSIAIARHAMATRFEIVLHGDDPVRLRAAAEEALDEVDRLEAQLSLYRPGSEISQLNQRAAAGPMRVSPNLFRLLQQAQRLSVETGGAFDITVAPLMRCWGFMGGAGQLPDPAQLAEARTCTGMSLVQLNENDFTVRFARPGVMLDLGAIGKGCALERAADILREAGVTSALLHGGTSTVYAIGTPPEGTWKVVIEHPLNSPSISGTKKLDNGNSVKKSKTPIRVPPLLGEPARSAPERLLFRFRAGVRENIHSLPQILATIPLKDEALSVSAVWGKSFSAGDKTYGHIIDPRTGAPTQGAVLAAVVLPSATETDALSTALLTLGSAGHNLLANLRPGMRTLLVAPTQQPEQFHVESRGIA